MCAKKIGILPVAVVLLAPIATLACVGLAYYGLKARTIEKMGPPENVRIISDFAAWQGGLYEYAAFDTNGARYYEARKRPPGWMVPSGYTCYVFNSAGQFVAWTWDSWDDPEWKDRWGEEEGREPVTLEQIQSAIKSRL